MQGVSRLSIGAKARGVRGNGRNGGPGAKEKLLRAAEHEFAANGLRGARMDVIARRAGVNKQLLYHYFGDKEEVYLATLERVYADFRLSEQELDLDPLEPWLAVERFVTFKFRYLAAHPNYVALLMDENMHRGRHVRRSKVLADMHANLVEKLALVLRRGEVAGVFRKGIDPLQLYISLAGLCYFYFGNIHTLTAVLRRKLSSRKAIDERCGHVIDLVRAAILRQAA